MSTSLERVRLEELVGRALLGLGDLDRVDLDVPEDLPDVPADVGLAERVLANVARERAAARRARRRHRPRAGRATDRCCDVVDHGPGVPAGDWDALFVPFSGAVRRRLGDRGPGNLGLGLTVARGFAAAMAAA